ncbi:MAG TPA: mannosyltransferase family protein [Marmoricola sp.]|nr:mannosyltransferase family protein [Marmoricola sp.]
MTHPEALAALQPDESSLGEVVWDAVLPFAAWRIALFGLAAFANSYLLPGSAHGALKAHGLDVLTTTWNRFDSTYYLAIAQHGYSANSGPEWVFYPLYPLLVRILSVFFGGGNAGTLFAALVISNAAAVGTAAVLYLLVRAEWGRDVARRTSLYLAVFPLAFYLSAPYAESLFVLLCVSCLLLTRQHHWIAAGAVAALAAATRPPGVMLGFVILCEVVLVIRRNREDGFGTYLLRPALGLALVPVGLLAFLAWGEHVTGDWLTTFHVNAHVWGRQLAFPWTAIANGFRTAGWGNPGDYLFGLLNLVVLLAWLVGVVAMARRFRPTYTVFTVALFVLSVTSSDLQSLGRQALPLVPLLVLLAIATKSESTNRHQLVLVGFSGLCAVFLTCYVLVVPAIA